MPVYAKNKEGKTHVFDSERDAGLFGYSPISFEDYTGIQRPKMTNLLGADGKLLSQYQLQARPEVGFQGTTQNINTSDIQRLRDRTGPGQSEYARILLEKQGLEEQNALGAAGRGAAAANSSAFSEIARRGGLSSGARERLAAGGAQNSALAQQGVLRQGMTDRLGITASDEAQKLDILKSLPGFELQLGGLRESEAGRRQNLDLANRDYSTNVDKLNIMGSLGEVGRQDNSKLMEYQEKMKALGAEKTAQAQANAGKK